MAIDYEARVRDQLASINKAVTQGALSSVELARELEAVARRIRRKGEKESAARNGVTHKGKYGRLCNANRARYREDVNFYYWKTTCNVAQIVNHLGISAPSVAKLIMKREDYNGDDREFTTGKRG
jgi:hypothetical protein